MGVWLAIYLNGSVLHVLVAKGCHWVFGLLLGVLYRSTYIWCLFLALVCGGYWVLGPGFQVVRQVES